MKEKKSMSLEVDFVINLWYNVFKNINAEASWVPASRNKVNITGKIEKKKSTNEIKEKRRTNVREK